MGKIRTRVVGDEKIEEKQKKDQKERSKMKKMSAEDSEKAPEKVESKEVQVPEIKEKKKKKKDEQSDEVKKTQLRGKKYLSARNKVEKNKTYSLKEAIDVLKKITYVDFDESVEIHLNVDKSGLKGEVEFAHTTGKALKVKIVDDKILEAIEKGIIDFDILISHPSYMPKLTKFAKILGPRGLMPNPKAGTLSTDPEAVAKKFSGGMVKWKSEPKFPLAHQMIAKLSHPSEHIVENAETYLKSVGRSHILKAYIKSTMSPSLAVDISFL